MTLTLNEQIYIEARRHRLAELHAMYRESVDRGETAQTEAEFFAEMVLDLQFAVDEFLGTNTKTDKQLQDAMEALQDACPF